jgi:hypothetical protein
MNIRRFWKWRYIVPAAVVLGPVAVVAVAALAGWIVMLLWNWLLPPLFGWREITLWQGAGLLALCRILFGGWGGGGGGGHSRPMTPEERERVRQRVRDRSCDVAPAPESPGPRPTPT